jgi:serine/threonine protein kinase
MDKLPEKRTERLADSAISVREDERTIELDRETLDEGPPKATNGSAVNETDGTRKTEVYRNDYERALPSHYRLIRMIGRGGMSEVFLAEDERLGRNVAIKFLNSEFRRDPERMRRFNREARAASALNHPNILTIHDIGENEGVQFIVSEFVEGETLGTRIARGPIPIVEAVRISIQTASALAASHNAGIVHRDIKPDNVMIRRDGSIKVLDFGLAKETGSFGSGSGSAEAQTLENAATSPGLILGTPQYMSPEQARGKPLDARTDIFSFGVILFEMVTGRQPFPGASMVDIIAAVIGKEPRPLTEYLDDPPDLLSRIIEKTLRKDAGDRYASMEHVLSDLRDLQHEVADLSFVDRSTRGDPARDTRPNTIRTFLGASPRRKKATIVFAIVIPVLALLTWWFASGRSGSTFSTSTGSMRMVPIMSWSSETGELVAAASFSPDTRMIAFAPAKAGATEIWVRPVEGGEPIQITKNGYYNQYPIWSPNGQNIAFFSRRAGNNGIWRTSFTGGEQLQVAAGVRSNSRPVLWGASGKIYFQENSDLFAADERTGEKVQVTDMAAKGVKPRTIEISPDESSIAYSVREDGQWNVYTSDVRGDRSTLVASSPEQIDELAWDANGKDIVFSSSAEGTYQVFRTGIGYAKPVQLSNGNLDFFVRDVSTDGSKILYGSVAETSDIWSVSVTDGKQTPLANEVASEFWPDISPDGKSIAFQSVSQADRPYRGSVISKATDGNSSPVVLSPEGFAPVYSPDGQWAAFFRRSDSGISIWRVRANGGDAAKLADGGVSPPSYFATPYLKIGKNHFAWSIDSASIAYVATVDGTSNVWLASQRNGATNTVMSNNKDTGESYCCPSWTPDGKRILFSSEISHSGPPAKRIYRLWELDVESSLQRIIFESDKQTKFIGLTDGGTRVVMAERQNETESTAIARSLRIVFVSLKSGVKTNGPTLENVYVDNIELAPDGETLAFVTRKENVTALSSARIDGGPSKVIVTESDPKILYSTVEWSPDGRWIIFGKQTRTNLLSMLSN